MAKVRRWLLSMIVVAAAFLMPQIEVSAADEQQMLNLVNNERKTMGLAPYELDRSLSRFALIRAKEQEKVFSHERPDGTQWYTVSELVNSENIAKAENGEQAEGESIITAWMQSVSHKENVLSDESSKCGFGIYQTNGMTYVVMLTD